MPEAFVSPKNTERLDAASASDTERAAAVLRRGGLVAIPTETVYGVAADALNAAAVEGIFAAKGRPHWDPLIVHVADQAMLARVVREVPPSAQKLMDAFWPGPLTLLLPRRPDLSNAVTAGRDLVGVRMPAHPAALALLRATGLPLAAPSANRFGHISPTTAAHVLADLDGRIDAVLDAGPCAIGVESTVLDPQSRVLYRQGGVSLEAISDALGEVVQVYEPPPLQGRPESLPSPGVGIRHYAPRARLLLVASEEELQAAACGLNFVGVMLPEGWVLPENATVIYRWARWEDAESLARTLYDGLRTLDAQGVSTILCPLPAVSEGALVNAIRDRLLKAARQS